MVDLLTVMLSTFMAFAVVSVAILGAMVLREERLEKAAARAKPNKHPRRRK